MNLLRVIFRILIGLFFVSYISVIFFGIIKDGAKLDSDVEEEGETKRYASPIDALSLGNFSWSRGGFGSVMIASFRIKNSGDRDVRDVTVRCSLYASSGTHLSTVRHTIYETFKADSARHMSDVNIGFIHSQSEKARCDIESASYQ